MTSAHRRARTHSRKHTPRPTILHAVLQYFRGSRSRETYMFTCDVGLLHNSAHKLPLLSCPVSKISCLHFTTSDFLPSATVLFLNEQTNLSVISVVYRCAQCLQSPASSSFPCVGNYTNHFKGHPSRRVLFSESTPRQPSLVSTAAALTVQ